jgi:hypothetical protein
VPLRIVPHARTLRKAREQVKVMVADGFSTHRIRSYLRKWALWWVMTSEIWSLEELIFRFIKTCWDQCIATITYGVLQDSTILYPITDLVVA